MTRPVPTYLRACAVCSVALLVCDLSPQNAYCRKHQPQRPPFAAWAAGLASGDRVYLQPYAAWRGLSHSEYLIVGRDGDTLTVQLIGVPESRMDVGVAHCADHDVTKRSRTGPLL
jgi:hypothetical protein